MAGFFDFLTGSSGKFKQTPRFNPMQQNALSQLLSRGMQNTDISALTNQAKTNFSQNTMPSLAERFTSLGGFGDGGQRSSGFQQALSAGGVNLDESLAALGQQNSMQQLNFGMSPMFETNYMGGSPGLLGSAAGSGVQGLMRMLPFLMM